MGKLVAYNFLTLNGYYKGAGGDISWHPHDEEGNQYAAKMLDSKSTLLFGRTTYEMMAGYWPSSEAARNSPEVAAGMNESEKIVFSSTLKRADWNNTRIVKDNMIAELKKLKNISDKNMTILGSGTIITQLAQSGLIDEYQFAIDPVAIKTGTPVFQGISQQLELELFKTKTFKSGTILLFYQPKK